MPGPEDYLALLKVASMHQPIIIIFITKLDALMQLYYK